MDDRTKALIKLIEMLHANFWRLANIVTYLMQKDYYAKGWKDKYKFDVTIDPLSKSPIMANWSSCENAWLVALNFKNENYALVNGMAILSAISEDLRKSSTLSPSINMLFINRYFPNDYYSNEEFRNLLLYIILNIEKIYDLFQTKSTTRDGSGCDVYLSNNLDSKFTQEEESLKRMVFNPQVFILKKELRDWFKLNLSKIRNIKDWSFKSDSHFWDILNDYLNKAEQIEITTWKEGNKTYENLNITEGFWSFAMEIVGKTSKYKPNDYTKEYFEFITDIDRNIKSNFSLQDFNNFVRWINEYYSSRWFMIQNGIIIPYTQLNKKILLPDIAKESSLKIASTHQEKLDKWYGSGNKGIANPNLLYWVIIPIIIGIVLFFIVKKRKQKKGRNERN